MSKCCHCGTAKAFYCYGCGEFVCPDCDRNERLADPAHKHNPEDHLIEHGRNLPEWELVAGDCVVCNRRIPESRGRKITCSDECYNAHRARLAREKRLKAKEDAGLAGTTWGRDDKGRFVRV